MLLDKHPRHNPITYITEVPKIEKFKIPFLILMLTLAILKLTFQILNITKVILKFSLFQNNFCDLVHLRQLVYDHFINIFRW